MLVEELEVEAFGVPGFRGGEGDVVVEVLSVEECAEVGLVFEAQVFSEEGVGLQLEQQGPFVRRAGGHRAGDKIIKLLNQTVYPIHNHQNFSTISNN